MANNNPFIVVLLYPNCRMRNGDNVVTFECQNPILFCTKRVETLSDLKSLISSKVGGTQARKIRRVAYRLLAPMGNGVFRFRLCRLHGDEHVRLMFDIHGRIMCEQVMKLSAEVGHGGSGVLHKKPICRTTDLLHHCPFMSRFQSMRQRRVRKSQTRITWRTMETVSLPMVEMRMSLCQRHLQGLRRAMCCLYLTRFWRYRLCQVTITVYIWMPCMRGSRFLTPVEWIIT
ncbi:hypothetical protein Ahy_B09g096584 isoform C [Arachis hypogaea]|uniref:Uncharacterized protein n=1 Tax=Arachis hypogaea TaxID=3818 RepID=A0A444XLJ0_ARAHY|nr:hypothetical protein Ahy_B09g096584 isoform C [Arachis hypogaea]